MISPTGRLVVLTRDGPTVAALTPRVRGGEKAPGDAPPYVVIVPLGMTPWVSSPAGQRLGVATWRHALRCVAAKAQGGDRNAEALGLAVVQDLHNTGPITYPEPGGSGKAGIYRLMVEGMSGPLTDPDTGEPYVVVTTSMFATAHAIA